MDRAVLVRQTENNNTLNIVKNYYKSWNDRDTKIQKCITSKPFSKKDSPLTKNSEKKFPSYSDSNLEIK